MVKIYFLIGILVTGFSIAMFDKDKPLKLDLIDFIFTVIIWPVPLFYGIYIGMKEHRNK